MYDTPIHSELNLQARMSFSVSAIDGATGIFKNIANLCRIGTHPSMPIETISNSTCDACKSHVVLLLFYKHSKIKQNCSILIKNMFFFRMHCNFSINVLFLFILYYIYKKSIPNAVNTVSLILIFEFKFKMCVMNMNYYFSFRKFEGHSVF